MFLGEGIRSIACTFSGFTLKPPFVTMKPRNFPSSMPKEHLAGFSFIFTLRNELNVFSMSFNIWSSSGLLTTRSSI
ncbi:hypothetical protein HanLR1_Chr09g0308121 [Helianthus annuus]|nr:hypothetical protein HanLR1_Chr09g0308121 [Helianthus annuus]